MPSFSVVRACLQCVAATLAHLAPGDAEVERLTRLVRTDELWTPPPPAPGSSGEHALSIRYRPPSRWRTPVNTAAVVSLLLTAALNWALSRYGGEELPAPAESFEEVE